MSHRSLLIPPLCWTINNLLFLYSFLETGIFIQFRPKHICRNFCLCTCYRSCLPQLLRVPFVYVNRGVCQKTKLSHIPIKYPCLQMVTQAVTHYNSFSLTSDFTFTLQCRRPQSIFNDKDKIKHYRKWSKIIFVCHFTEWLW